MDDADLSGEVLDRRYRVLERMSEGGMGVVYRGVSTKLDRPVAIKILHGALIDGSRGKKLAAAAIASMLVLGRPL